jgi:hypothetical protein
MDRESPPSPSDPVIDAFKKDVDQTLFDRTLALTPEQRIRRLQAFVQLQFELQRAGRLARGERAT